MLQAAVRCALLRLIILLHYEKLYLISWRAKGAGKTRTHCGRNIADVITFPKCWLVLPRAQHLWRTHNMFLKISRNFCCVRARRATTLPRFTTDGQHRRTQCCHHNVSSFCQGFLKRLYSLLVWHSGSTQPKLYELLDDSISSERAWPGVCV